MPRFAIVNGTTVENVGIWDVAPTISGRTVVGPLAAGQGVSPGDIYSGGVFTPRVLSPDEQRRLAAIARLTTGRTQLRQVRTQAQAASDATGALTLAQLTAQFRTAMGGVAILAQTLMDVELILAFQQDDGSD